MSVGATVVHSVKGAAGWAEDMAVLGVIIAIGYVVYAVMKTGEATASAVKDATAQAGAAMDKVGNVISNPLGALFPSSTDSGPAGTGAGNVKTITDLANVDENGTLSVTTVAPPSLGSTAAFVLTGGTLGSPLPTVTTEPLLTGMAGMNQPGGSVSPGDLSGNVLLSDVSP